MRVLTSKDKEGNIVQKMVKEEIEGVKKIASLRVTIAQYYQVIVKEFPTRSTNGYKLNEEEVELRKQIVNERFPHLSYGQDPKSKTFLNSYPLSFKNYLFKLRKAIIPGKNKFSKLQPVSMVMTVGAKDGIDSTKNVKLK